MRLLTIPLSHYCEKARWGLVYAGIDYVEEAHLQVFHYFAVRRHSASGKVPVLLTGTQAVTDSTAILQFLDARLPEERRLYPADLRAEVEALEEQFDEQLGIETRRWVYFHWLGLPMRQVLRIAAQGVPAWERTLAPVFFPSMSGYLDRRLGIGAAAVEQGLRVIAASFDEVAARLADGRRYLCGERFTAADLSFACMAAPILLPPQYGIRLPKLEEVPPAARADVERFRRHPAGQFGLRLFAEDKPQAPKNRS
jgi:glutathione S-transferase